VLQGGFLQREEKYEDFNFLEKVIGDYGIDTVFHLAALLLVCLPRQVYLSVGQGNTVDLVEDIFSDMQHSYNET
jgi:hypothetical protein